MDFKNTFTKTGALARGRRGAAFTLVEVLIASAIALVLGAAVAMLYFYSSRSFVTLNNYADMCQRSQLALDKMSKDIRQAKAITAYATNSITFTDVDNNSLQFTYNSGTKTLSRVSGGKTTTFLTGCDALQFWLYQHTPQSNSFACYIPATASSARVVQITWTCSRSIMGKTANTELMESAQIAMRNH